MSNKRFVDNAKFERIADYIEHEELRKQVADRKNNFQGSARQICLLFHYMRLAGKAPKKSGTPLNDAEFLSFISGLSIDNLRKKFENPFSISKNDKHGKETKSLLVDIKKVKFYFEKIRFAEGIELTNQDIQKYQNTLNSFEEE